MVREMMNGEQEIIAKWGSLLSGRQLLWSTLPTELQQDLTLALKVGHLQQIEVLPGSRVRGQDRYCQRCDSRLTATARLPNGQFYCTACLALGRVTQGSWLVRLANDQLEPVRDQVLTWSGELTSAQADLTAALLKTYQQGAKVQLLWAVTGAGKTEITFPLIASYLAQGGRVGFVSPRVDVCNELFPRLQAAFVGTSVGLHHGHQHSDSEGEQLVVATIHQLIRYYQAFDLLIVDEVDAFPYVNDPMLERALDRAVKPNGQRLYLSATPPAKLRRAARQGRLPLHYLARRFHGRPLIQPRVVLGEVFQKNSLSQRLRRLLTPWLARGRRLLVFVPQAAALPQYLAAFSLTFPQMSCATVHAQDPLRTEKVADFRAGQGQILLTTTILERGVTLAHIDVLVLAADHPNFKVASLVQIAGRVGRASVDQGDQVVFFSRYYSWAMGQACHQIKHLNRLGGF
ncbi:helicase-related protein [Lapidilactobacillus luobeiensis]|uniref:helicase-related protein n=1 Tax=Lapidilactobacillus luobeiensis TaxID=2950371 RepID=UPI0021C2F1EF|nr:helicase-related protein [Lapidilactobacillus luobeiensis]